MKYSISLLFVIFIYISAQCQSYNIDTSTDANIGFNVEADIGHSFSGKDFIYAGAKILTYKLLDHDDNIWDQKYVHNGALVSGLRYMFRIKKLKHKENQRGESELGIYPEVKAYFSPYVPRKFTFTDTMENKKTVWGNYEYQFAYGFGIGIYIDDLEDDIGHLALKFEISNLDSFKIVRGFKDYYTFPEHSVLSIGISVFLW